MKTVRQDATTDRATVPASDVAALRRSPEQPVAAPPPGTDVAALRRSPEQPVAAPPPDGLYAHGDHRSGTRERVARAILENGPSTAAALGERLSLTPAAVRRHLDALLDEGMIEAREERVYGQRGRGRPAKVFMLTDSGRGRFEQAYDDLAVSALRFLAQQGGEKLVMDFARHRIGALEARYGPLMDASSVPRRVQALAEALSADGYAASAETSPVAIGEQLCQHHCPVAHVAEQFPQLCEAETEAFARLLGTHVQRLATIAHGDGVCTTHIPHPDAVSDAPRGSGKGKKNTSHSYSEGSLR